MRRPKPKVTIIIDTRTLQVEHVYIGNSVKEATDHFLNLQKQGLDGSYSDVRDDLVNMLERYTITELHPTQVTVRRGL